MVFKKGHPIYEGIEKGQFKQGTIPWNKGKNLNEKYNNQTKHNIGDVVGFCGDGCGAEIIYKKHHKIYGIPKFIHGHNKGHLGCVGVKYWLGKKRAREGVESQAEKMRKLYASGELIHPMLGKHQKKESIEKGIETRHHLFLEGKLIPGFLGKHHTKESNEKNRLAHAGKKLPEEWCRKIGEGNRGKKHTVESIKKSSEGLKKAYAEGRMTSHFKELNVSRTGIPLPEKQRKNMSIAQSTPRMREIHRNARLKTVFPIKDNPIEVAMQNALKELGIPFRKHEPITGQPDIFIEPNFCVFVDGCLWHNCPSCGFVDKIKDKEHGIGKSVVNKREKDAIVTKTLQDSGYQVLRYWEHDIKKNAELCALQIRQAIEQVGVPA